MSGHSKWSTIKRQKGANDKARGQLFTKLGNSITIAVKEGGGIADPEGNIRLRLAIEKAKEANMPKTNIERAIDRALGKLGGNQLEEVVYEGFAPLGVAVLVEAITDNKQRTVSQLKNLFSTHGGSLGSSGSVSYLFERVGAIHVTTSDLSGTEEIILETNAQDFEVQGNSVIVYTLPTDLHRIKSFFLDKKLTIADSELMYKPTTSIEVDAKDTQKIITLLEAVEELEDVQKVHANASFVPELHT